MKKILIFAGIGIIAYVAYKQCKKKKGSCNCNGSQDQSETTILTKAQEIVPDAMREVYDASASAFFRPVSRVRKRIAGVIAEKEAAGEGFGAGTTDVMDMQSAINFVKQS